jgi:hypothetical protein
MGTGRLKNYDLGVIGLFVLVIVGVSLNWYRLVVPMAGGSLSAGGSGWHYGLAIGAFIAALLAVVVVVVKVILLGSDSGLPVWYHQGYFLNALGGLVTLFSVGALFRKPVELMGVGALGLRLTYGAGLFITMVAGLLITVCGYMARNDLSIRPRPPRPAPTPRRPTTAGRKKASEVRYCPGCGTLLEPELSFCRWCSRPKD